MEYLVTYVFLGVLAGGVYSLIGLGVVLIYKATKVFNFAVGDMVVLGGALAITFINAGLSPFLSIVLSAVLVGLLGILIVRGVLSRMMERPIIIAWIAIALFSQVISGINSCGWGGAAMAFPFFLPKGGFDIGGVTTLPKDMVLSFVVALGLIGIFMVMFRYTKVGLGMKAIAEQIVLSRAKGIKARQMWELAWIIGGVTAALGGVFFGYRAGVNPALGMVGLKAFPIVFLGGLDSVPGVILAGAIIGVTESLTGGYVSSEWAILSPFVILLLILVLRPQGLLGQKEVERV